MRPFQKRAPRTPDEAAAGPHPSSVYAVLWVSTVALLLAGCPDSWSRTKKAPTSSLWIAADSAPLEVSQAAKLQASGIGEAFVEVAVLDADDEPVVRKLDISADPAGMPVHLAIRGSWNGHDEDRADALGEQALEAVRQLRFDAESRGWVVLGVCFQLDVGRTDGLAKFFGTVHRGLDDLLLTAVASRELLAAPEDELADIASSLDVMVPILYGQRPGEPDDKSKWDLGAMEKQVAKIEELGVPYQIGVVTLGTASYADESGKIKAQSTELSMQQVMADRNMRLRPGFTLDVADRRVYTLHAEGPARVGPWRLTSGELVRVVRAATYDLEELHRMVGTWPLEHHLGEVYYRLPTAAEGLSLPVDSLVGARDAQPATPDLVLDAGVQRRVGRGWLLRFAIENLNREFTELSFQQYNQLDIVLENGTFATELDPGDFYRYELFRFEGDGEPRRTIRNPNMLRLHVPVLEGDQRVSSGDVRLSMRGDLRFRMTGLFLLPDGRKLELGPALFAGGELTGDDTKSGRTQGAEESAADAPIEASSG